MTILNKKSLMCVLNVLASMPATKENRTYAFLTNDGDKIFVKSYGFGVRSDLVVDGIVDDSNVKFNYFINVGMWKKVLNTCGKSVAIKGDEKTVVFDNDFTVSCEVPEHFDGLELDDIERFNFDDGIKVSLHQIGMALQNTEHNNQRYVLDHVLFDVNEKGIISTGGHTMYYSTVDVGENYITKDAYRLEESKIDESGHDYHFIVSSEMLKYVQKCFDSNVSMHVTLNKPQRDCDDSQTDAEFMIIISDRRGNRIKMQRVDGRFPKWEDILIKESEYAFRECCKTCDLPKLLINCKGSDFSGMAKTRVQIKKSTITIDNNEFFKKVIYLDGYKGLELKSCIDATLANKALKDGKFDSFGITNDGIFRFSGLCDNVLVMNMRDE